MFRFNVNGVRNAVLLSVLKELAYVISRCCDLRLYFYAVRMFLDHYVVAGLFSVIPAKSVKLPNQSSTTGKTPLIVPEQVRQTLDGIPRITQADYRDRALITMMVFPFFRISAALSLSV